MPINLAAAVLWVFLFSRFTSYLQTFHHQCSPQPPNSWLVTIERTWADQGGIKLRLQLPGQGDNPRFGSSSLCSAELCFSKSTWSWRWVTDVWVHLVIKFLGISFPFLLHNKSQAGYKNQLVMKQKHVSICTSYLKRTVKWSKYIRSVTAVGRRNIARPTAGLGCSTRGCTMFNDCTLPGMPYMHALTFQHGRI